MSDFAQACTQKGRYKDEGVVFGHSGLRVQRFYGCRISAQRTGTCEGGIMVENLLYKQCACVSIEDV